MLPSTSRIKHPPMSPDERIYFAELGSRIATARSAAGLTQVQLADALAISQPQLASYEVGRRRVPVSMLPALARLLGTPVEALISDTQADTAPNTATPRRTKRGPASKLEQQLEAVTQLPRARQKFVSQMLDTMLAASG